MGNRKQSCRPPLSVHGVTLRHGRAKLFTVGNSPVAPNGAAFSRPDGSGVSGWRDGAAWLRADSPRVRARAPFYYALHICLVHALAIFVGSLFHQPVAPNPSLQRKTRPSLPPESPGTSL